MKNLTKYVASIVLFWGVLIAFTRCSDEVSIDPTTTNITNMYSYMKENTTTSYSQFSTVVEKAGYDVFLNAYGTYTLFLPTDEGVKAYLSSVGKSSVDNLSKVEAQNLVKNHLIKDTLGLATFTDGRINKPTLAGQYLLSGAVLSASEGAKITINKFSSIVKSDVRVGNGIIHIIDNVIVPGTKTLAQLLEEKAEYSIFTQALKETGYFDTLNSVSAKLITVVAEPNEVLAKAGFNSYAKLKARYSTTGNPKLISDSLNLYVAFHIIDDAKYLGDLVTASSHLTKVSTEPTLVSATLMGDSLLLNDEIFNGIREVGVSLNRSTSDNIGLNGILHQAQKHYTLKVRKPTRIDWDLTDFPELRRLTKIFRKADYYFTNEIVEGMSRERAGQNQSHPIGYRYNGTQGSVCTNRDCVELPMGNTGSSLRNAWYKMNTTIIPKGKYKVWVCYRYFKSGPSSNNLGMSFYLDDTFIGTHNMISQAPAATNSGELEALGWKYYMYQAPVAPATFAGDRSSPGKMVGFIDVKFTGKHRFEFVAVNDGSQSMYIDMIQFIPVNDNQVSPRYNIDGSLVY